MKFQNNHVDAVLSRLNSNRILSVDVFRGIAIAAMILVNNPGSWSYIYAPLEHAHWHGWTATDLIFPFFLFIVGLSVSISIPKQKFKGITNSKIIVESALRMLKLLGLGWFLALFYYQFDVPTFSWIEDRLYSIRIMGVLQRIGFVYFASVCFYLMLGKRMLFICSIVLMIIYYYLMQYGMYETADGQSYQGLWLEGNNFAAWLDQSVLGSKHVYAKTMPFVSDPEGLLSTLPAISTCLSGILVGHLMAYDKMLTPSVTQIKSVSKLLKLLTTGIVLVSIGNLLDIYIPINKSLWTPSYVLLTSGLSCLVLASCHYLIDIKGWRIWSVPFIVFGLNSIAFFMFAGIVGRLLIIIKIADISIKHWLYETVYEPLFGLYLGSLMFAVSFLILSYFVMFELYRRSIFWKV